MNQDETFGEISFLQGGSRGANASVIANSDDGVELTIIEGYYINALFNVNPGFAGRFYQYLSMVLAHRINVKNRPK